MISFFHKFSVFVHINCSDIIKGMGVTKADCHRTGILLLDRNKRRIANMEELQTALQKLGLNHTQIDMTQYEGMSLKDQLRKVLQVMFMPHHLVTQCFI